MKHLLLLLVFLLALPSPTKAAITGQELLLFYSGDVRGETAPCGCQTNQLGGLAKKGFQFRAIASQAGAPPHLTLDAGDLLFMQDTIAPGSVEQAKMAAEAIVGAYNLIGYDAVAIGSRDLSAGVPYLLGLRNKAKFAWLSANLVATSTKQPIFKPSLTVTAGTVKVRVIALTGPSTLPAADEATVLPWDQVLPGLMAGVANGHDLVILLSNLPAADNQRIAESYSAIPLIIQSGQSGQSGHSGHSGQSGATGNTISPAPVNNTLMVSTAPQGNGIGIMKINWRSSGRWGDQPAELLAKRRADLDRLLWQLGKYQQGQDPEAALRDQPDQLKAYHALRAREQALRGEIERLGKAGGPDPKDGEPSSYANRFMVMEDSLPDQPEVVALTDQLDRALNQRGRELAQNSAPIDTSYLGPQGCGPCHAAELTAWRQTKHAKAYTTLADKDQQFNTNCLPCHVTGVTMDKADDALSVPENRRGVGCETCHGPGRRHAEAPKDNALPRRPGPEVCRGCHAPPHDTTFDYERNSKLVH